MRFSTVRTLRFVAKEICAKKQPTVVSGGLFYGNLYAVDLVRIRLGQAGYSSLQNLPMSRTQSDL